MESASEACEAAALDCSKRQDPAKQGNPGFITGLPLFPAKSFTVRPGRRNQNEIHRVLRASKAHHREHEGSSDLWVKFFLATEDTG